VAKKSCFLVLSTFLYLILLIPLIKLPLGLGGFPAITSHAPSSNSPSLVSLIPFPFPCSVSVSLFPFPYSVSVSVSLFPCHPLPLPLFGFSLPLPLPLFGFSRFLSSPSPSRSSFPVLLPLSPDYFYWDLKKREQGLINSLIWWLIPVLHIASLSLCFHPGYGGWIRGRGNRVGTAFC